MAPETIKRHPLTRLAHYAFLIPFLPALRPLLVNFRIQDMVIYIAGMLLVTFLVIYGNHRPLVRIDSDKLSLYLHYRHNAEEHPFSDITSYSRRGRTTIILDSKDHKPVSLKLKGKDADALAAILEEKGIHV